MSCLKLWRNPIDVLIDIDDTLVHAVPGGPMRFGETNYELAHGALEFVIALDRTPGIRIGFYSCGVDVRNHFLIQHILWLINNSGKHKMKSAKVFTVVDRFYGKKTLKGLRKGLNLNRTVLVDDLGMHIERDEEKNLLKLYTVKKLKDEHPARVYKARVDNNLVRALGLILTAIEVSEQSVVKALNSLQWDGDSYLHESTNSEDVYIKGLKAMQSVNPVFELRVDQSTRVLPWSPHADDDELFPKERHLIIKHVF